MGNPFEEKAKEKLRARIATIQTGKGKKADRERQATFDYLWTTQQKSNEMQARIAGIEAKIVRLKGGAPKLKLVK